MSFWLARRLFGGGFFGLDDGAIDGFEAVESIGEVVFLGEGEAGGGEFCAEGWVGDDF